ncbi:hypothetical protein P12x_003794 [Tundrisphaera lichenicola]|uniref:hypothetical protein n=1 Tax=Tundrisphaera lichenicola TaxID=2029860 RepID=UPI003EBD3FC2
MSLSVAAIQPPSAIYREEQRFGWWIYGLLALIMGISWLIFHGQQNPGAPVAGPHARDLSVGFLAGLVLPLLFTIGLLRMTTVVNPSEIRVWFGFVPTYRRSIPIGTVRRVEVVQYRPIADFGGWGLQRGRDGEIALNARGNRGVRLHLIDGSRILIGSQRPEDLALAVEGALRTGA